MVIFILILHVILTGIPSELHVVSSDHQEKVNESYNQVQGIREVLARDHMKVAFFGRYSRLLTFLSPYIVII